MKTKIQKWGNSLGVRLPKNIAEQKALHAGLGVSVLLKDGQIIIEPDVEDMTLKQMLSDVSAENLHSESDWTDVQGNEVW